MSLMRAYDAAVACGDIKMDAAQKNLIPYFQSVQDALVASHSRWFWWHKKQVIGLYLYGPVGVGKTYLMDLFFQIVPEPKKVRYHFHHFMQQVDAQLRCLQGQKDPLRRIAADIAKSARLLCLDEFLVHDVAHAMILAELLQALFAQGVVLVATANTRPDDLYLNGVQRARFLPAIALIKQDCQVVALEKHSDYRLGRKPLSQAYLYPLNQDTAHILKLQFNSIAEGGNASDTELRVQHRSIPCVQFCSQAVWFEFDVICNLPRCQLDYLELAGRFHTMFVSNIPVLTVDDTVRVILFVHLIDVLYDRGIHLVVLADAPIEQLYVEGPLSVTFQRTVSRLQEMQSEDYLLRHPYHRNLDI